MPPDDSHPDESLPTGNIFDLVVQPSFLGTLNMDQLELLLDSTLTELRRRSSEGIKQELRKSSQRIFLPPLD